MVLPDDDDDDDEEEEEEEEEFTVGQRVVARARVIILAPWDETQSPPPAMSAAASAVSGQTPMKLPQKLVATYLKNRIDNANRKPQATTKVSACGQCKPGSSSTRNSDQSGIFEHDDPQTYTSNFHPGRAGFVFER